MPETKRTIAVAFAARDDARLVSEHLSALGYDVCSIDRAPDADVVVLDAPSAHKYGGDALRGLRSKGELSPFVLVALPKAEDSARSSPA